MKKLSFEEWVNFRAEYEKYLAEAEEKPEEKPNEKSEDKKPDEKPDEKPENSSFEKELAEIKKQMEIMAKALSPALGDINPVGIDDVVNKIVNRS